MSWLPEQLMTKTLKHEKMRAQNVKQFLVLICGIETKMQEQEQMDRSGRERFMMEEYSTWQEILVQAKAPRRGGASVVIFYDGNAQQEDKWRLPFSKLSGRSPGIPPGPEYHLGSGSFQGRRESRGNRNKKSGVVSVTCIGVVSTRRMPMK